MVDRSSLLWERKGLLHAVTVFLASAVVMCVVFGILGGVDRYVYLWPLTGLQLGFLLPYWTRRGVRIPGQAAGVLGVLAGGLAMGLPFWFAVVVAAISGLDVWIAGAILSRGVSGFEDLKFRRNLQLFAVAAIVAPVVAGVISGAFVAFIVREPVVESSAISILSDSLGMAVVLPVLLFLLTGKYRFPSQLAPHLKRGFPALILFVAVAALVFWQMTNPFLFMVFPTMLLVVLGFGLEGSVFVSVSLTVIACYATAHGHGPILLGHSTGPIHRLIVLQLFLWMSTATALPMGALLDEHRRAEDAADEATVVYQTLLENAEDMIVLSSIDGNHRYVSAASERLTGWTPAEYLAIDRLSTFHPDDRDIARLVIESMLSGKQEHMFRYRLAQ
jgi:integral membrane sensor domain MASE1